MSEKVLWGNLSAQYYGNGTVFVARRNSSGMFEGCNFQVERLDVDFGPECWLAEGVMVAANGLSREEVIKCLKRVLARVEKGEGLRYLRKNGSLEPPPVVFGGWRPE